LDQAFNPSQVFHWGYVVPDMERALKHWQKMGAQLVVPPSLDPIQNVLCALLVYRDAAPIELVAPAPSGPNPLGSRLEKGGGLDHVCFFSEDVAHETTMLRSQGGVVVVEPSYGAVFDRQLSFVVTRPGLVVELMARQPAGRLSVDPLPALWPGLQAR
jgi:methylmalonyl-CoA/ethylmalonyl-CoA epimerase